MGVNGWQDTRPGEPEGLYPAGAVALTEFLTARLDEDEAVARAATTGAWRHTVDPLGHHVEDGRGVGRLVNGAGPADTPEDNRAADAEHIARHDPARVLREVEAKRAILAAHSSIVLDETESCETCSCWSRDDADPEPVPCPTLRHLAAVYSDHPDYDEAWRPT